MHDHTEHLQAIVLSLSLIIFYAQWALKIYLALVKEGIVKWECETLKIIVLYNKVIIKTIVQSNIIVSSFTHLFIFLIYTFVKIFLFMKVFPYNIGLKRPGVVKGQYNKWIIIWKLFPQLICFLVLGSCWYLTKLIPYLILGKSWPYCNNLFPRFNWLNAKNSPKNENLLKMLLTLSPSMLEKNKQTKKAPANAD